MERFIQASENSTGGLVEYGSGNSDRDPRFGQIIGKSASLKAVFDLIECVAPTDSTVLIQGETGTGKELITRSIHDISTRREGPLQKLNCSAIPHELIESELFGHERGSFTGAIAQRVGRFELAHKGTLFLDEVGDLPLALQPKLLRVLQEREFERLGGTQVRRVDVRLVAATNRDLAAMVKRGEFRSDLYYRLNVFPLHLPPLRERREDIPLLVNHFVRKYASRMKRSAETVPRPTMEKLVSLPWPGNVRELQNIIERGVILSRGSVLEVPLPDLPPHSTPAQDLSSGPSTLEAVERNHILRILRSTRWVIGGPSGAAAHLGLNRSTLNARMRKLEIRRPQPA